MNDTTARTLAGYVSAAVERKTVAGRGQTPWPAEAMPYVQGTHTDVQALFQDIRRHCLAYENMQVLSADYPTLGQVGFSIFQSPGERPETTRLWTLAIRDLSRSLDSILDEGAREAGRLSFRSARGRALLAASLMRRPEA